MRIGLISCSKKKLDHAAEAQDLYIGDLFKLSRAWIEKRTDIWAILSAQHGLLLPFQVIEPYDLALKDLPAVHRERWADLVYDQLMERWGDNNIYTILAGAEYRAAVRKMPHVEDVIGHWTQQRRDRGMSSRRASIGIGLLKKFLKEDKGYY